jgi:hypothetical protein
MKKNAVLPAAAILLCIAIGCGGPRTPIDSKIATTATTLPAGNQTPDDRAAIRQAALDYVEGWYDGDGARMERALHKELTKRIIRTVDGTEEFTSLTKREMVEMTRQGGGKDRSRNTRNIKVEILDVYRDIASVRTECADYVDYLQLAKSQGQWKIVNVLWQFNIKNGRR